jgi:hypothetical protein
VPLKFLPTALPPAHPNPAKAKFSPKLVKSQITLSMVTMRELLQNGQLSLLSSPSLLCGISTILDIKGPRSKPFLFMVLFSTEVSLQPPVTSKHWYYIVKMDHKLMSAVAPPGNL